MENTEENENLTEATGNKKEVKEEQMTISKRQFRELMKKSNFRFWHQEQSQEDKEYFLARAEAKRERKAARYK